MFIDKLISTVPQVTADNPLAAAHQIRQLTERGWAPDRGHLANGELTGNPGIQWELERVVDLWDAS